MDAHVALVILFTLAIGYLMLQAGLQKSALEWRRRKRVCPSCGRVIETRLCRGCTG